MQIVGFPKRRLTCSCLICAIVDICENKTFNKVKDSLTALSPLVPLYLLFKYVYVQVLSLSQVLRLGPLELTPKA